MTAPQLTPLFLDWETYYDDDYSLRKLPTAAYILDPRYKTHGVGIALGGEDPVWLTDDAQIRQVLAAVPWDRVALVGHNLPFDGAILAWRYGYRPAQYRDTLGMSRALIGTQVKRHGLDFLGKYFGVGGKLDGGKALKDVKGVVTPSHAQLERLGWYCATSQHSDVNICRYIYDTLAPHMPEGEWAVLDWTVRMFIDQRFKLNKQKLVDHEAKTREEKRTAHESLGLDRRLFTSRDKFAKVLQAFGVQPPMKKSKSQAGGMTYAFAKNDLEFRAIGDEHPDPFVRELVRVKLLLSSTIEETRAAKLAQLADFDRFGCMINYSGAMNTHRFSGGGGFNAQNLSRNGVIRSTIEAPEGHKIVVADSSQIELRVALALANDATRLGILQAGDDLYCHAATGIYNTPVVPDTHPNYEPRMKTQRTIGKVATLSLQYQSAAKTFQGMAFSMGGVHLEELECENVVRAFRANNPGIVNRWTDCKGALQHMLSRPSQTMHWTVGTGLDPTKFFFGPDYIQLPRGLHIKYPNIRQVEEQDEYGKPRKHIVYDDARYTNGMAKLYGGKVFENIVQALATNIYVEQAMAINKVWPVSLSVHDEVVLVVPDEHVEYVVRMCKLIMRASPSWWPNLPLNCSADVADNYGAAK